MIIVLDSSALIALLRAEPGAEVVDAALTDKGNICIAHAINLCEVYYDLVRVAGERRAVETINRLVMAGVYVREDMDTDFWQSAGNIKATYARVSIADCLCIALATRMGAEIWTTDRHELESLAQKGLFRARFVR